MDSSKIMDLANRTRQVAEEEKQKAASESDTRKRFQELHTYVHNRIKPGRYLWDKQGSRIPDHLRLKSLVETTKTTDAELDHALDKV